MDDRETLNRRARLRELIARCFDSNATLLLDHIERRTGKRPNQGELSGLQQDNGPRSFGDKKARNLSAQIGLHRRWFDLELGANVEPMHWTDDEIWIGAEDQNYEVVGSAKLASSGTIDRRAGWPFPSVQLERILALAPADRAEIESDLLYSVEKAERRSAKKSTKPKRSAA